MYHDILITSDIYEWLGVRRGQRYPIQRLGSFDSKTRQGLVSTYHVRNEHGKVVAVPSFYCRIIR